MVPVPHKVERLTQAQIHRWISTDPQVFGEVPVQLCRYPALSAHLGLTDVDWEQAG